MKIRISEREEYTINIPETVDAQELKAMIERFKRVLSLVEQDELYKIQGLPRILVTSSRKPYTRRKRRLTPQDVRRILIATILRQAEFLTREYGYEGNNLYINGYGVINDGFKRGDIKPRDFGLPDNAERKDMYAVIRANPELYLKELKGGATDGTATETQEERKETTEA